MTGTYRCHVAAPRWCDQVFSDGSLCRWPRGHDFFCFAGLDRPEHPRIDGWTEIHRSPAVSNGTDTASDTTSDRGRPGQDTEGNR